MASFFVQISMSPPPGVTTHTPSHEDVRTPSCAWHCAVICLLSFTRLLSTARVHENRLSRPTQLRHTRTNVDPLPREQLCKFQTLRCGCVIAKI